MHFHFRMTKTIKRHKERHENLLHLSGIQSLQRKRERKKERKNEWNIRKNIGKIGI